MLIGVAAVCGVQNTLELKVDIVKAMFEHFASIIKMWMRNRNFKVDKFLKQKSKISLAFTVFVGTFAEQRC